MNINSIKNNKEIKNAAWIIAGRVIQMILSLFIGILTARYLGPGNYGLINYGNAYVGFFTAISNLGLNSIIVKEFVDHPNEQGETIGSVLFMRLISSVFSAVAIISIVSIIDNNEPITIAVVALCSLGLVFQIFETFNYWFQNQYKSKITSIATLIAYLITSIYRIILLIFGKDVQWFAFAASIDYIVLAVILFIAYKKNHGEKLRVSIRKSKALLKISYNYILSSMMVAIYGQTDKLMLKQMLDEDAVGYYSTATALCTMWTFVLNAIIDSMFPTILRLAQKDKNAFEGKNRQLYAIVFYICCFVSVCFVLFGEFAIGILYGEDYLPAAPVLSAVTWYTAFSYLGVARDAWVISEGKQKYLKYMYGCAAIMNVIINALLIPVMGAVGAAVASLITQIFTSIVLPMFFKEMRPNVKLMLEAILLRNVF